MKTLGELENENPNGFRNPIKTVEQEFVLVLNMNTMGNLFDEHESELLKAFKSITPEQLAKEELERKIKREYEALHTSIETDADRANKDEYPDEESEQ